MADEMNWLLTDEFVAFSVKIKDILDRKKAKKQELKDFYDKIQADYKALEDEARAAEGEFQAWKKSQATVSHAHKGVAEPHVEEKKEEAHE